MKLFARRAKRSPMPIADIKATYAGQWVAILGGRVIAHGLTAAGTLNHVIGLGQQGRGCTIVYVSRPEEIKRWAVAFDGGRIGPNGEFHTREQAERWGRSWLQDHKTAVLMHLVDDDTRLHGRWEEVGPIASATTDAPSPESPRGTN